MFVAVSMTETTWPMGFATYRKALSGRTAMNVGLRPTGMVATSVLLGVSKTVTSWPQWFVT